MLNTEQIMGILPHRPPFLFVDKVIEMVPNESIVGIKNVGINEPFFDGHFPGKPIMPGVIILEAMAQAAGILYIVSTQADMTKNLLYFMSVDKVKFRRKVVPGDQLRIEIKILSKHNRGWKILGKVLVEDKLAAEGEIVAFVGER